MKIIGHSRERAALEALVRAERIPHALILSGPAAVGKRLVARYFFWKLCNPGLPEEEFEPSGMLADVLEVGLDAEAREISIMQIRKVRTFVSRTPFQLPAKLVLIDDADRMSAEAANALLKTLEEPASHTYFALISERPRRIPLTLRSRCMQMMFRHVPKEDLLSSFHGKERAILEAEFAWIAGRPGLAFRLIQDSGDAELVARKEAFARFVAMSATSSVSQCLRSAEHLSEASHLEAVFESGLLAARETYLRTGTPRLKPFARAVAALRDIPLNKRLAIEDMLLTSFSKT